MKKLAYLTKAFLLILEMRKRGLTRETVKLMNVGDKKKIVISHEKGIPLAEYVLEGEAWKNCNAKIFSDFIRWDIRENGWNMMPGGATNIKCII